ncbi:GNAT family N-acetyltransferase [Bacillus sp. KH172YL63]|uniref:GNAT family N-acetyltransferase n=1 Tax=Bacillus sp. KH172YL63 TaxID=2709784 RepID=UPI0013E42CBA|nr:GNAT family N-acetyltransferase [Bacillus sp. KH172YL63]BCB03576.1 hypothetical protein KH172YL63_17090 [Bacillus sp. KH172YL63]
MTITYEYYQNEEDIKRQYDFWKEVTRNLPYAWKPTKSPLMFREQAEFDPRTRCFAYEDGKLVGYMSFTGRGDFVSLGYPWVLPGYEIIQDELFHHVHDFAVSNEYGGRFLAQRFRHQWEEHILYFEQKGFEIRNESDIIGCTLTEENIPEETSLEWRRSTGLPVEEWKGIVRGNEEASEAQISMMEEYYESVDWDGSLIFSCEGNTVGVMAFTIRDDTAYSEVLAFGILQEFEGLKRNMIQRLMKEVALSGGRVIAFHASDIPDEDMKNELGLQLLTKDVMLVKEV